MTPPRQTGTGVIREWGPYLSALLKFDDLNLAESSYEFKPEEASDKPRVSLKAVLEEVRRQEFIEIT
jgi:hypothetical protein